MTKREYELLLKSKPVKPSNYDTMLYNLAIYCYKARSQKKGRKK